MINWQPIETAPKDGTIIYLLTIGDWIDDWDLTPLYRPPAIFAGRWNPNGSSWTDANGSFEGEIVTLTTTGNWQILTGGWLQPNEVSHWAASLKDER